LVESQIDTLTRYYLISKQLISWIESYLSDRQQKVVSEGFSSTLKGIKAGVPQGSMLDPFLFLVYINDIVTYKGISI
jgi:hypothetical protein